MTVAKGIKISELANELQMTDAELVLALNDLGVKAEGPASLLDFDTAVTVRQMLAGSEKSIEISATSTLKEIAEAMGVAPNAAVKKMMELGQLVAMNQRVNKDAAEKIAAAFGFTVKVKAEPKPEPKLPARAKPGSGVMPVRPPVVTIMGHVDHGKTSLLDTIRKTNVASGEFGGITQHIGAYQVEIEHNGESRKITFLDTPGHAAFTAMRARGARVTDIVILVVAADDGIMPQTVEAIQHARAAEVPIIVAINKIDKDGSDHSRIKQQLTAHNLVVEEYGGDIIAVPVSAKTGVGVKELLEYIVLVAEVNDYRAESHGHAVGAIVEASIEPGRGPVATVLVQSGTLHVGDCLVAGCTQGKVRAMTNERGERLYKAGPSTPVEVQGLSMAPDAGDTVEVVKNEREARKIVDERLQDARTVRLGDNRRGITIEAWSEKVSEGELKDLNVIVKGDVQGSVEAVVSELNKMSADRTDGEVRLTVKLSGVGTINESDVSLAVATNSIVIGFNVRADQAAQRAAERDGVEIRTYNIIYNLTEDIDRAMNGLLAPIFEENILGTAKVLQRFQTPKGQVIAGSMITDGKLLRGADVRIIRGGQTLFTSRIDTLRRIKDDVREVAQGFECGIVVENWNDVQPDDVLQCYEMKQIQRF
jgi:translation initiation factor IF-2